MSWLIDAICALPPCKFDNADALFLFLFLMSTRGITFGKAATLFGCSVGTVHNTFYRVLDAVLQGLG